MSTTEPRRTFVLVLSYYDRSGIQAVFGPFDSEDDAQAVKVELQDINLDGLWEFFPLRSMIPTSGAVSCG